MNKIDLLLNISGFWMIKKTIVFEQNLVLIVMSPLILVHFFVINLKKYV